MKQKPKVYGLIGDPVSHSLSPVMQNKAFKKTRLPHRYYLFNVESGELEKAIEGSMALGIGGLNVTIPHKEAAYRYCSSLSREAKLAEAVNTINFDGKTKGYNTDIIGAKKAIEEKTNKIDKAVVVGAGGAARGVSIALRDITDKITILNRTEKKAEKLKNLLSDLECQAESGGLDELEKNLSNADLLVNATPVGMHPDTNKSIATEKELHPQLTVFDLVYRPIETKLLKIAKEIGAETIDGVEMLVQQGAASFKIWTDVEPPINLMRETVKKELDR